MNISGPGASVPLLEKLANFREPLRASRTAQFEMFFNNSLVRRLEARYVVHKILVGRKAH